MIRFSVYLGTSGDESEENLEIKETPIGEDTGEENQEEGEVEVRDLVFEGFDGAIDAI